MLFYNRDSYIYTTRYFVFAANPVKQTAIDLYRFFVGLVGSIFVMLGMKPLYSKFSAKLQHLFSYIGRETMGIYIISGYIFTYILPRITSSLSGINCFALLIETLAVLVFSLLATIVIRKIPLLNCLLLGSK